MAHDARIRRLIAKISALPAARITEVEDFVERLGGHERDRALVRAAAAVSAPSFAAVWDNAEDSAYDDC